jgi:DNA ligase-1
MKPMLAIAAAIEDVTYPIWVGVKYDGIRALVVNGVVLSRSLKPIPNAHVQKLFGKPEYNGLDGELILGDIYAPDVFRKTTSAVMSDDGEEDVKFHVFDSFSNPELDYAGRVNGLSDLFESDPNLIDARSVLIDNLEDLREWLESERLKGGEGLIGRYPTAPYKFGRSTLKSGSLLKFKFFVDAEFEVIGFEEQYENTNEATVNELGRTSRSSHKENMVPKNTLGSLILKWEDKTFRCGTGFTDELRQEIWDNKDRYLGTLAKIRYMDVGMKDLPRFPAFKGFRSLLDL